jgi:transcriptional regulator with XRE-family HTH domain
VGRERAGPTTTNLLNTEFIKRRRVELGLSTRALASAIRTTASGLRAFERDASQGDLTLALLERLARALACDVTGLFSRDRTVQETSVMTSAAGDAGTVGQLLQTTGVLTPVAALAEVTGWSKRRVDDALDELEQRLPRVGLTLHRLGSRVSIRPAGDVDGDLVAGAVRAHINRDGLNITEVRLLRRILDGDMPPQPTNAEQVALGVLVNARLVVADGPGSWKAHPDVEFSFSSGLSRRCDPQTPRPPASIGRA